MYLPKTRMAEMRILRGESQAALASRIGISQAQICLYELAQKTPTEAMKKKLEDDYEEQWAKLMAPSKMSMMI